MHADQNHPSISRLALGDRRGSVLILSHDAAPVTELRTVLPVLIHCSRTWGVNHDRFLADPQALIGVYIEPDSIGQVQAVVDGIAAEESASANSQIMQAAIDHCVVNIGRGASSQILANRDRVAARYDEQLES